MKITKLFLTALACIPLFYSCTNDEDVPVAPIPGAYENGFFVLNEGTATTGTVTFVNNDLNKIQQNIYSAVNPGDGIGGFVQSIFFNGDLAYIISNGSNKITIVNRYTFKLVGKIETGLAIPRYGVVVNGKAYVTNANTYGYTNPTTGDTDDYVAVINLTTNVIETTITLLTFGDKIEAVNGKVYVANGSFGSGNTMKIINTTTNTISSTLTFGSSPNSMFEKNGNLYVLCSDYVNPSELVKINTTTNLIATTLVLDSSLGNAQNLNFDNNKFYFSVNKKVFDEDLTASTISTTPLFTTLASSIYGMAVKNSRVFISDPVNYTLNGKAFIYSSATGTLQNTIDVGVIPNGFYFN